MQRRSVWWLCLSAFLVLAGCRVAEPTGSVAGTLVFSGAPLLGASVAVGAAAPARFVPGEVVVAFAGDVLPQASADLVVGNVAWKAVRDLAVRPSGTAPGAPATQGATGAHLRLYRASGMDAAATLAAIDRLRRRSDVAAADPNWILRAFARPDDSYYPLQWDLAAIDVPGAWAIEDGTGSSITVAVIDTGAFPHPDLADRLLPGYDFVSDPSAAGDGDGDDPDPTDLGGVTGYHGSHVAGTIAAVADNAFGIAGINWGARVVPVRALGADGGGTYADILDAVTWAGGGSVAGVPDNANPARVINLSLGGDVMGPCPSTIAPEFQSLADAGVVVVAAAGNAGTDASTTFPANCPGVIAVGATGPDDTRAAYSNYGGPVTLMAPGGDTGSAVTVAGATYPAGIWSTVAFDHDGTAQPAFAAYEGTSMATPHVSGIVSLMLARDPALDHDQVLARLRDAAVPLSAAACGRPTGSACGAGLINAAAAVAGTRASGLPAPPPANELRTHVAAFACAVDCSGSDLDLGRSQLVSVTSTGGSASFVIPRLATGTYTVAAWQDSDGDGTVDAGEPFGTFVGLSGDPRVAVQEGTERAGIFIVLETSLASGAGTASEALRSAFAALVR